MDRKKDPSAASDWVIRSARPGSVERIEAWFGSHGYDPHRHDTTRSVAPSQACKAFITRVRCATAFQATPSCFTPTNFMMAWPAPTQVSLPHGLHRPWIDPERSGWGTFALHRRGLSNDPRLYHASQAFVQAVDHPLEALEEQDALYDLAMALRAVAGKPRGRKSLDYRSAERARAFILEHLHLGITLEMLENASGRERWSLSRDFRALYGTSPYRFVTLRRLDRFRGLILDGFTLVDASLAAGFHDQSHMTRHFTRCYGVPPMRWLERLRPARGLAGSYKIDGFTVR
jgi:AraC-like DNA-binding protein